MKTSRSATSYSNTPKYGRVWDLYHLLLSSPCTWLKISRFLKSLLWQSHQMKQTDLLETRNLWSPSYTKRKTSNKQSTVWRCPRLAPITVATVLNVTFCFEQFSPEFEELYALTNTVTYYSLQFSSLGNWDCITLAFHCLFILLLPIYKQTLYSLTNSCRPRHCICNLLTTHSTLDFYGALFFYHPSTRITHSSPILKKNPSVHWMNTLTPTWRKCPYLCSLHIINNVWKVAFMIMGKEQMHKHFFHAFALWRQPNSCVKEHAHSLCKEDSIM